MGSLPKPEVDWSTVQAVCHQRSVLLESVADRPAFDDFGPLAHADSCWLGKNYRDQPNVWYHGCDCGAIAEFVRSWWRKAG